MKRIWAYGLALALLLFLLKWLQWRFLIADEAIELYMGLIALSFTLLGIWISRQLSRPAIPIAAESQLENGNADSPVALQLWDLSEREYEVLQLMAKGLSNAAISERLFLSLSTVKTHASNLFLKMEVKSRMQAVVKARESGLLR